jgi:hypothetical protein
MYSIDDIKNILNNWDIPETLEVDDVTHTEWETSKLSGWKTWKVGADYYLKTNERSKMIKNIVIAKALSKQRLSSEFLPIPTRQGNDYLEGELIFLLTKRVGNPLNNRPLSNDEITHMECNDERAKNAYQLGNAIARLHMALKSVQDDIKPYEGNLYEQGKKAIPVVRALNLGISESFYSDYSENFSKLHDNLPKQLVHGNLTGDTAVYKNGEVVGFKGFETYSLSFPRVYDITWGAGEINAQPLVDVYLDTLTEMLKGYDSVSPLTTEEKQSVYYVLCATYLKGYSYYTKTDETADLMARSDRAIVYLANNKEEFMNLV